MNDAQEPQALPPELAELANLAAAADATLDAGQALPPPPGQQVVTLADQGEGVAAMLKLVAKMAEPVAPYIPRAYDDATCDSIGLAFAAVAEKRGWDLTQMMSPELTLAFVTIPPTLAAMKMAKDYYAWLERQQATQGKTVAPAPEPALADGG